MGVILFLNYVYKHSLLVYLQFFLVIIFYKVYQSDSYDDQNISYYQQVIKIKFYVQILVYEIQ